jgi:hypothetical protein
MAGGYSADITNLTKAGITLCFNEEAKNPQTQQYKLIVHEYPEEKAIGLYRSAGDVGNATLHTEGNVYTFEGIDEAYNTDITTLTYGKGLFATRKQMKDDMTGTVKGIAKKLLRALANTKEQVCADAYNDGFSTNSGSDSVYTFSSTHSLTNCPGKYNDNLITGDITTDNLEAMITQFCIIYDMAGNKYPTKMTHLLANTMQQFTIYKILESEKMAYELSNTKKVIPEINPMGVILNDYIDHKTKGDTYSPWFGLDRTLTDAGAVLQYRGGVQQESEVDFKTKNWQITAEEEYACAFISPGYGAIGSLGT